MSNLTGPSVSLADKYLQDNGCVELCVNLQGKRTLTSLDLRGNDIGTKGFEALGRLLVDTPSLRSLCLEWNNLGEHTSIECISHALCHCDTICHLDLRNNKLDAHGAVQLAYVLKNNTSLNSLDLRWNHIGSSGGVALAEALAHNTSLTSLPLSGNKVSRDTLVLIEEALQRNKRGLVLASVPRPPTSVDSVAVARSPSEIDAMMLKQQQEKLLQALASADSQAEARIQKVSVTTAQLQQRLDETLQSLQAESTAHTSLQNSSKAALEELERRLQYEASRATAAEEREKALIKQNEERRAADKEQMDRERAEWKERMERERIAMESNFAFERKQFDGESKSSSAKIETLQKESTKLNGEIMALRQRIENEDEKHQDRVRRYNEERKRLMEMQDQKDSIAEQQMDSLRQKMTKLAQELDTKTADFSQNLRRVQGQLEHNASVSQTEMEIASQAAAEKLRLSNQEVESIKEERDRKVSLLSERVKTLESQLLAAENNALELRQESLKAKIENEEKFMKFEATLREEMESKSKATMEGLEDRMLVLQQARDQVLANAEKQRSEYDVLVTTSARERKEHSQWLEQEREHRQKQEKEYQLLLAEVNSLKSDLVHKAHQTTALEEQVEQLCKQREAIVGEQQQSLEQMLVSHALELRTLEDKVNQRENKILELQQKLRKSVFIINQLRADQDRREESVQSALNGLRHTLTEISRPPLEPQDQNKDLGKKDQPQVAKPVVSNANTVSIAKSDIESEIEFDEDA
eukprot:CAMPEP_0175130184 /NCGR_PEP_ID=MMETSP0087-20121206/5873_1 /TAXON_ID=136419 /ORGANISM="Unknown Unknown, Strain D1" /LENGTH=755 /DNA_ID=CAMNT_0016412389 /DNA_START=934 /DNA_END=3201 /DNA_ORIENTATION=+